MTISYQRDVASSTAGGFTRLLFKWKGSLYKLICRWQINKTKTKNKLICRELLLFLIVYSILGAVYREVMNPVQKR